MVLKKRISIILSLILVMALATPVFAAVSLDINGRAYEPSSELLLENGVTLVPFDVITDALGCEVTTAGDQVTYQKNGNSMQMNIGSTTAVVNGTDQIMPMAPRMVNGQAYVPLRFVLESLGAQVGWNGESNAVSVTYNDTRNDMTAEELMAKASVAMAEANQYKMLVDMQGAVKMKADVPEGESLDMSMDMNGTVEAWAQIDPMVMYMKQDMTIAVPGAPVPGAQAVQTEMVMNRDGIFMTMPEIGWVKMDLEGLDMEELMKQSMAQDPTTVMQQMKDLGMSFSFDQDQEKNGKKYWVIKAYMDGDILNSDYFKQLTQQIPGLEQDLDLEQLLKNLDLDLTFDQWIDQETFYTDYMNLSGDIRFVMDLPADPTGTASGPMEMTMTLNAAYAMSDYGQEFALPDIQNARDFEEVMAEQMALAEEALEAQE
jgi:hypothetical protein